MDNKKIEDSVRQCYSTWGSSYYTDFYTEKAAYPPVHCEIIKDLLKKAEVSNVLEAGCGPASLLRHFIDLNIDLYGFDLTPEMLNEGKRVFKNAGLNPNNLWLGSAIDPESFEQPHGKKPPFNAAICVGVFPHIPAECDIKVMANLRNAVSPGGLVIIEARNQLFSLFTLNRYSKEFFLDELIRADELKRKTGCENSKLDRAINELLQHFSVDIPPIRKGKANEPGYDEVLSRTHNPFVLKEQFEKAGFKDIEVLFYHYHCIPPMLSGEITDFFVKESIAMENPRDWRGYFMASAFLIVGKRND